MLALPTLLAVMLGACAGTDRPQVIVYTSVDQQFAEPVLKAFEAKTGVRVLPVYDTEAAKTTGLANRLIAEQGRPLADVWWSGEFAQTVTLAERGVLAPYRSPAAADIPAAFKDPGGLWTGFGGRARVLLANTERLKPAQLPDSLSDLASDPLPGDQIGLAYPVFGTAATQAAALYAARGPVAARAFFQQVAARGVRVVDGNAVVRDLVADGQLAWGIVDTDDACGAVARGAPVTIVVPDQGAGGPGTLVVPNTAAKVKGGPNPGQAEALLDYLLSRAVEADLIRSGWFQISPRGVTVATACPIPATIKAMVVDLRAVAAQMDAATKDMTEVFVR
jgi:iron(III) transport system substrate-binding protein